MLIFCSIPALLELIPSQLLTAHIATVFLSISRCPVSSEPIHQILPLSHQHPSWLGSWLFLLCYFSAFISALIFSYHFWDDMLVHLSMHYFFRLYQVGVRIDMVHFILL